MQSVLDDLMLENITIKVTTTETPKSAVEIYLELLQSMIKPTHEEQVLPDNSPVVDIGVLANNNNEGNIDYTDEYYEEFLSNQAVLSNFSEEDLLIGDSFETEGNINLMLEEDEEHIVDQPTPTTEKTREMFNSAFPELYRDLEIFDQISRGRNKGSLTRNFRNRIVEKRVKKKIKKPRQSDEEKVVSEVITTEQVATSTVTARPHIQLSDLRLPKLPRFVDAEAELDKDVLVMTSSGSLYGRRTASSKGLTLLDTKQELANNCEVSRAGGEGVFLSSLRPASSGQAALQVSPASQALDSDPQQLRGEFPVLELPLNKLLERELTSL